MTLTLHFGVDLAWGPRNRTGLAAVSSDGRLLASASARTDDEIIEWITAQGGEVGVVAIDAPLIVANARGFRPCESELSKAFRAFEAATYPANLSNAAFNPPRGATLAERLGIPLDPFGPRTATAIEVYPHPAMVGLWGLERTVKYKFKPRFSLDFRRAEFDRLLDLIEAEAVLQAARCPRWHRLRREVKGAPTNGALDRLEDEVDGIVCAWLAWLWATRDDRLLVYGDALEGYIVAPLPPDGSARSFRPGRVAHSDLQQVETRESMAFGLSGPTRRWVLTNAEARHLERELQRFREDT